MCVCAGVGSVTAWPSLKSTTFLDFVCMCACVCVCVCVQEWALSLRGPSFKSTTFLDFVCMCMCVFAGVGSVTAWPFIQKHDFLSFCVYVCMCVCAGVGSVAA